MIRCRQCCLGVQPKHRLVRVPCHELVWRLESNGMETPYFLLHIKP